MALHKVDDNGDKKLHLYLIEKSGGYATASATVAWASAARWVMRAAKAGIW